MKHGSESLPTGPRSAPMPTLTLCGEYDSSTVVGKTYDSGRERDREIEREREREKNSDNDTGVNWL